MILIDTVVSEVITTSARCKLSCGVIYPQEGNRTGPPLFFGLGALGSPLERGGGVSVSLSGNRKAKR